MDKPMEKNDDRSKGYSRSIERHSQSHMYRGTRRPAYRPPQTINRYHHRWKDPAPAISHPQSCSNYRSPVADNHDSRLWYSKATTHNQFKRDPAQIEIMKLFRNDGSCPQQKKWLASQHAKSRIWPQSSIQDNLKDSKGTTSEEKQDVSRENESSSSEESTSVHSENENSSNKLRDEEKYSVTNSSLSNKRETSFISQLNLLSSKEEEEREYPSNRCIPGEEDTGSKNGDKHKMLYDSPRCHENNLESASKTESPNGEKNNYSSSSSIDRKQSTEVTQLDKFRVISTDWVTTDDSKQCFDRSNQKVDHEQSCTEKECKGFPEEVSDRKQGSRYEASDERRSHSNPFIRERSYDVRSKKYVSKSANDNRFHNSHFVNSAHSSARWIQSGGRSRNHHSYFKPSVSYKSERRQYEHSSRFNVSRPRHRSDKYSTKKGKRKTYRSRKKYHRFKKCRRYYGHFDHGRNHCYQRHNADNNYKRITDDSYKQPVTNDSYEHPVSHNYYENLVKDNCYDHFVKEDSFHNDDWKDYIYFDDDPYRREQWQNKKGFQCPKDKHAKHKSSWRPFSVAQRKKENRKYSALVANSELDSGLSTFSGNRDHCNYSPISEGDENMFEVLEEEKRTEKGEQSKEPSSTFGESAESVEAETIALKPISVSSGVKYDVCTEADALTPTHGTILETARSLSGGEHGYSVTSLDLESLAIKPFCDTTDFKTNTSSECGKSAYVDPLSYSETADYYGSREKPGTNGQTFIVTNRDMTVEPSDICTDNLISHLKQLQVNKEKTEVCYPSTSMPVHQYEDYKITDCKNNQFNTIPERDTVIDEQSICTENNFKNVSAAPGSISKMLENISSDDDSVNDTLVTCGNTTKIFEDISSDDDIKTAWGSTPASTCKMIQDIKSDHQNSNDSACGDKSETKTETIKDVSSEDVNRCKDKIILDTNVMMVSSEMANTAETFPESDKLRLSVSSSSEEFNPLISSAPTSTACVSSNERYLQNNDLKTNDRKKTPCCSFEVDKSAEDVFEASTERKQDVSCKLSHPASEVSEMARVQHIANSTSFENVGVVRGNGDNRCCGYLDSNIPVTNMHTESKFKSVGVDAYPKGPSVLELEANLSNEECQFPEKLPDATFVKGKSEVLQATKKDYCKLAASEINLPEQFEELVIKGLEKGQTQNTSILSKPSVTGKVTCHNKRKHVSPLEVKVSQDVETTNAFHILSEPVDPNLLTDEVNPVKTHSDLNMLDVATHEQKLTDCINQSPVQHATRTDVPPTALSHSSVRSVPISQKTLNCSDENTSATVTHIQKQSDESNVAEKDFLLHSVQSVARDIDVLITKYKEQIKAKEKEQKSKFLYENKITCEKSDHKQNEESKEITSQDSCMVNLAGLEITSETQKFPRHLHDHVSPKSNKTDTCLNSPEQRIHRPVQQNIPCVVSSLSNVVCSQKVSTTGVCASNLKEIPLVPPSTTDVLKSPSSFTSTHFLNKDNKSPSFSSPDVALKRSDIEYDRVKIHDSVGNLNINDGQIQHTVHVSKMTDPRKDVYMTKKKSNTASNVFKEKQSQKQSPYGASYKLIPIDDSELPSYNKTKQYPRVHSYSSSHPPIFKDHSKIGTQPKCSENQHGSYDSKLVHELKSVSKPADSHSRKRRFSSDNEVNVADSALSIKDKDSVPWSLSKTVVTDSHSVKTKTCISLNAPVSASAANVKDEKYIPLTTSKMTVMDSVTSTKDKTPITWNAPREPVTDSGINVKTKIQIPENATNTTVTESVTSLKPKVQFPGNATKSAKTDCVTTVKDKIDVSTNVTMAVVTADSGNSGYTSSTKSCQISLPDISEALLKWSETDKNIASFDETQMTSFKRLLQEPSKTEASPTLNPVTLRSKSMFEFTPGHVSQSLPAELKSTDTSQNNPKYHTAITQEHLSKNTKNYPAVSIIQHSCQNYQEIPVVSSGSYPHLKAHLAYTAERRPPSTSSLSSLSKPFVNPKRHISVDSAWDPDAPEPLTDVIECVHKTEKKQNTHRKKLLTNKTAESKPLSTQTKISAQTEQKLRAKLEINRSSAEELKKTNMESKSCDSDAKSVNLGSKKLDLDQQSKTCNAEVTELKSKLPSVGSCSDSYHTELEMKHNEANLQDQSVGYEECHKGGDNQILATPDTGTSNEWLQSNSSIGTSSTTASCNASKTISSKYFSHSGDEDSELSPAEVVSDDDSLDEVLNETPSILKPLEQECNHGGHSTHDDIFDPSQLSDNESLDLDVPSSPVLDSKPTATSKSAFSLDFLLAEKIEKEEENRELDIMHAELKEGIKKGGFAKLTFDTEDVTEGDLLPEYQQKLHHFKVSKSVIEDVHPGDRVFSADQYQQLFTENILPQNCGFVPKTSTIDRHLSTIQPALVCDLVNTNTLSLCFHVISCKDALLRWLFFLMSIHNSSVLLLGCKRVLFDILHAQHCSNNSTTWSPDVLDVLRVFVNYGAKMEDLMIGQNAFTEEEIRQAVEVKSNDNIVQDEPDNNAHHRLNQENISMVIQTISYALQGRPTYSTAELNCLLVIILKVALDTSLNNSALDYDLQVCVASILEKYDNDQWPEMVPGLCIVLSKVTTHHHNKVHMAQLLPSSKRGRYMQRRLSYVFLRQMLFPSEFVIDENELKNLQVKILSTLFRHICELASEDLYALASAITLLDMSVGNECLKSSEKADLDYLTNQLKYLMSDVRDNVRMLDKTRVKDMMVRVSSKWTLMMHSVGSLQKSLFAWAKDRSPQTMTVERLETGQSDQETEVSDETDEEGSEFGSPERRDDVQISTCDRASVSNTETDKTKSVLKELVSDVSDIDDDDDDDDVIMLSNDSNEDYLPDPQL